MDYKSWYDALKKDAETLQLLISMLEDITPTHDTKLNTLMDLVSQKTVGQFLAEFDFG